MPMTFKNDHEWLQYLTRPRRFLLIDDDADTRALFRRYAEPFNCVIEESHSMADAMAHFCAVQMAPSEPNIDGVFLDLNLDNDIGGGVAIFRALRRVAPELPVVVVSGFLNELVIEEINAVGFAAFVRKPTDFNLPFFRPLFALLNVRLREQLP